MSFFISDAYASSPNTGGVGGLEAGGDPLMSLILPIGLVFLFYFMLIRPQSKRQKEHKEMVAGLQKGEEVVTTGGILGKITKISDNFVTLDVGNEMSINVQKNAIANIMPKGTIKEQK